MNEFKELLEVLTRAVSVLEDGIFDETAADAVREDARALLNRLDASPPAWLATVERIDCVTYEGGYEEPSEPVWRIEINGQCADFPTEAAAQNFADAISGGASPWRDIRTAPQDGTHVLVRFEGTMRPPTVAHWFGPPDLPGLRAGGWYLSV